MTNEKIKTARSQLGQFFKERRIQMRHTEKEMADFLSLSENTIKGVESGRFAADIDTIFRFCEALELKPFFAQKETINDAGSTFPNMDAKEKFQFSIDVKNNQLYILHRLFPACLIQVIQTLPVTFRVVDLYDDIDEADLATHDFLEEAKKFWKDYGNKILGGN